MPLELAELQALLVQLEQLPPVSVAVRLHAAARVAQRLAHLKRQAGSFGFADMLQRLDTALAGDNGAVLRERILAQYPVALIDEFRTPRRCSTACSTRSTARRPTTRTAPCC